MELLAGTPVMQKMQKNRLLIVYYPNDEQASYEEIGLPNCEGLYFVRLLQNRDDTIEILFENPRDMDMVEQGLTQYKLGLE